MLRASEECLGHRGELPRGGAACSPYYVTLDAAGANSLELRTCCSQEMIARAC